MTKMCLETRGESSKSLPIMKGFLDTPPAP